jgi:predicted transposase/invertase (TIGR01784 family)
MLLGLVTVCILRVFNTMKKVASLRYSVIFKKAFSNVDVFKGFARDILGINIDIEKVETEKVFSIPLGNIHPRFDLYAEDKKNRVIVEIQHERYSDYYDRFLHYHCLMLLEQVKNYIDYQPPLRVYTIVVLTSMDKHKKDVSLIDFDPVDLAGNKLGEIHHKIIYLCPKYCNEKTPTLYQEWLDAITDSYDGRVEENKYLLTEIQQLFNEIEIGAISSTEQAIMLEENYIEEKRREGFEKGVYEGKLLTAKMLFSMGMSAAVVRQATGLCDEQLMEIE